MTYQMDAAGALLATDLPFPKRSGKVRDVYDMGDRLLIVSTDRISAFDWILPVGIPGKGTLLTQMSEFWFGFLDFPNHFLSSQVPDELGSQLEVGPLQGRVMVVRKAQVVPFECVARGYLEGSGWQEYQANRVVCGIELPADLQHCSRLPQPIFTPATKAETGHDMNVGLPVLVQELGEELATRLRDCTLDLYSRAATHAAQRGIIIADTKFEFGLLADQLLLVDEALTPDSSRFWSADDYQPGRSQDSFDKQFVRQWLSQTDWDKNSPPPALPEKIVKRTKQKYQEAHDRLVS